MWKVVQANAGLVTEYELLQLLRQRGLRTPLEEEEETMAERRAAAGPDAAPEAGGGPEALYPQINAPFAVERAVRRWGALALALALAQTLAAACVRSCALSQPR